MVREREGTQSLKKFKSVSFCGEGSALGSGGCGELGALLSKGGGVEKGAGTAAFARPDEGVPAWAGDWGGSSCPSIWKYEPCLFIWLLPVEFDEIAVLLGRELSGMSVSSSDASPMTER